MRALVSYKEFFFIKKIGTVQEGVLEYWSMAEKVMGALERCGKLDWSASVVAKESRSEC